jgi:hypothetical protein
MSTPTEPRVPHGTRSRYVGHGCRCEPCRAANTADRKARYVGNPLVDAAPVVAHVRALQAAGLSRARIARAARVGESTLDRICRTPGARMLPQLAKRVLRVRAPAKVAL